MYELIANDAIINRLVEENANSCTVIITHSGTGVSYDIMGTVIQIVQERCYLVLELDTGGVTANIRIDLNDVLKCEYINQEYFDLYLTHGKLNVFFLK